MINPINIFSLESSNDQQIIVKQPVDKNHGKFVKPTDKLILAVDFDGTIVLDDFPNINGFIPGALESLKFLQSYGVQIILWTCRDSTYLKQAVDFLSENGLVPSEINKNSKDLKFKTSSKIYGDYYLDDRSYPGFSGWDVFIEDFKSAYGIK